MKEDFGSKGPRKRPIWRLGPSESGRIWAGLGGVMAMAAGAALLGLVAFSADTPAGRVPAAEASHAVVPLATLEALPNGSKVLLCHTEGNGTQHTIESSVASVIQAGHFSASGAPLHFAGAAHDFVITYTIKGGPGEEDEVVVVNPNTCAGALATETPTNTATATNTAIATETQQIQTSTPTNTPRATNTPVNTNTPTKTPVNTNTPVNTSTPVPTLTNTPVPTSTLVQQQLGVQATPTPRPPVRALPTTGSGGYLDDSSTTGIGMALLLGGMLISLTAIRRRA